MFFQGRVQSRCTVWTAQCRSATHYQHVLDKLVQKSYNVYSSFILQGLIATLSYKCLALYRHMTRVDIITQGFQNTPTQHIHTTHNAFNNCLRDWTVSMLGCHAVVPGTFPGLADIFVWPPFHSLVRLDLICGFLYVCPQHPRCRVYLVRSYESMV